MPPKRAKRPQQEQSLPSPQRSDFLGEEYLHTDDNDGRDFEGCAQYIVDLSSRDAPIGLPLVMVDCADLEEGEQVAALVHEPADNKKRARDQQDHHSERLKQKEKKLEHGEEEAPKSKNRGGRARNNWAVVPKNDTPEQLRVDFETANMRLAHVEDALQTRERYIESLHDEITDRKDIETTLKEQIETLTERLAQSRQEAQKAMQVAERKDDELKAAGVKSAVPPKNAPIVQKKVFTLRENKKPAELRTLRTPLDEPAHKIYQRAPLLNAHSKALHPLAMNVIRSFIETGRFTTIELCALFKCHHGVVDKARKTPLVPWDEAVEEYLAPKQPTLMTLSKLQQEMDGFVNEVVKDLPPTAPIHTIVHRFRSVMKHHPGFDCSKINRNHVRCVLRGRHYKMQLACEEEEQEE